MDKKLIKYAGIVIGVLIVIIILSLMFNSATGGSKLSYESIEQKLVNAAKNYVNDKKAKGIDVLPESYLSDSYYISSDLLVSEGYLYNLSDYAKDETNCVGGVSVYNAGNGVYDYVPELTCGTYHETVKLADVVLKDNDNGITHGSGLYLKVNGKIITNENELNFVNSENYEYIFRGDIVNNYVKIDDNLWRIVSIDNSNNMLLIYAESSQRAFPWDDQYNKIVDKYNGVNDFVNNGLDSAIYRTLNDFLAGKIQLADKIDLSSKTKYLLVPMTLCTGKRSYEEKDQTGAVECKTKLENQLVGLLPAYVYMNVSLDPSCTTIGSNNCGNFNYLVGNDYWWFLTANSENTEEAYALSNKTVKLYTCKDKAYLKPTIKIGNRAIYSDGNGTLENPYTIKFYSE